MATSDISAEILTFDYQLSQIRKEIKTYFQLLVNNLKERERQLLTELEEIVVRHRREDQQKQSLSEIEFMLRQTQENIHSNVLKETQVGIVKMLEQQQREIKSKLNRKRISFNFDNSLLQKIRCFGEIIVDNFYLSSLPLEYKDKMNPVVSVGGAGANEGQFNYPWGVAVDHTTDNIYVVDQCNHRVQVFNKEGKYLSKFGDRDGVGKIKSANCIAISKDFVFVSKKSPASLLVYNLNGNFIKQICKKEDQKKGLCEPFGVTIDDVTGDIYVCDSTDNCVKIFSKDFSFKSEFGNGITFLRDIKRTNNKTYLLSCDPFLYIFNHDFVQVDSTISYSISKHLNTPNSFVIDGALNFIFPSYNTNNIVIFDKHGTLIHKITESISNPVGITLDSKGRIVVVGHNNRLLIF